MANQLTKQSSETEIKTYFTKVLQLLQENDEFPVNLDDVWPLVYAEKGKAVRALKDNNLFLQGVDYQVLRENGKQKSSLLAQNGKQNSKETRGGHNKETYLLSLPCLEFFIARKVRPVFEVYRKVFHKVAESAQPYPGTDEAPIRYADELYTILSWDSCIDEFDDPIVNARDYFNYVGAWNKSFTAWFEQRAASLSMRKGTEYFPMQESDNPKLSGGQRKEFALSLLGLQRLMKFDRGTLVVRNSKAATRLQRLIGVCDECIFKLDNSEHDYTFGDFVFDVRSCILGSRGLLMHRPTRARRLPLNGDPKLETWQQVRPTPQAPANPEAEDNWAAFLASDDTREIVRLCSELIHSVADRYAAVVNAMPEQDKPDIKAMASAADIRLCNMRTDLCNLAYLEQMVDVEASLADTDNGTDTDNRKEAAK